MNSSNFSTPITFNIFSKLSTQLFQTISTRDQARLQLTAFACRYNQEGKQHNWCTIANQCVVEYNSTPHSAISFTLNYQLYEIRSIFPEHLLPPSDLTENRKLAFGSSLRSHNANKNRYNRLRYDVEFSPGNFVFVENDKLYRNKLDPFQFLNKFENRSTE